MTKKRRRKMIYNMFGMSFNELLFWIFILSYFVFMIILFFVKLGNDNEFKVAEDNMIIQETELINDKTEFGTLFEYSKDWDYENEYLLAKIAMAEAEGCSTQTKEFVILTVLNRVWSDDFPDTIQDVIFQQVNGVSQFAPTIDGRWERVEPDEDSWIAVNNVRKAVYDKSQDCTFFECCKDEDNWHSRNLLFLFESDGVRFYKEK